MVAPDKVHLTEHGLTRKVGREVVDPRDWVPVILSRAVEAPEISTRSPAPPGLGAICSGEEYGLFERRMMPKSSRVWNSALAIASFSGDSRRAWACTGGPVVMM